MGRETTYDSKQRRRHSPRGGLVSFDQKRSSGSSEFRGKGDANLLQLSALLSCPQNADRDLWSSPQSTHNLHPTPVI